MSLGFHRAGFDIKGAFDLDEVNVASYNKNFPGRHAHVADLSVMTGREILEKCGAKSVDVIFGGPPCQGFSNGGLRKACDPRKRLIRHFGRIVSEVRPRYFVLENVYGLVMSQGRNALTQFLRQLRLARYNIVEPIQVLDASHYGIPQNRRRVFIFGHLPSESAPSYPMPSEAVHTTVWDAIGDLPKIDSRHELFDSDLYVGRLGSPSAYAAELRRDNLPVDEDVEGHQVFRLTGCQRTRHDGTIVRRFARLRQGEKDPISRFSRLKMTGVCTTIRAGTTKERGGHTAPRPIHPNSPRCITVREAARLHSFPDDFLFHPTIWHSFRQIGNSVPPLLAHVIASRVMHAMSLSAGMASRR